MFIIVFKVASFKHVSGALFFFFLKLLQVISTLNCTANTWHSDKCGHRKSGFLAADETSHSQRDRDKWEKYTSEAYNHSLFPNQTASFSISGFS